MVQNARTVVTNSVKAIGNWMKPSPKPARASSSRSLEEPGFVSATNAGDGYVTDGITKATGTACVSTGDGLWNAEATEQKGVFTNTFSPQLPIGVSSNEYTSLTDVNADGYPDIVFILDAASGANAGTYVWLNKADGTGQFHTAAIEKKTYTSTLSGGKIEAGTSHNDNLISGESTFVGDVNNDGKKDVVYVYNNYLAGQSGTYVWFGNGDGTFATAAIEKTNYTNTFVGGILAGASSHVGTYLVDADGDGKLDILYIQDAYYDTDGIAPKTFFWKGNGDGTFATAAIEKKTYTSTALLAGTIDVGTSNRENTFVADVTGDGKVDIVFVADGTFGGGTGTHVWAGVGDGTFQTAEIEKTSYTSALGGIDSGANNAEGGFLVDANNDGKLDFLYVLDGSGDSGTYLWLGQGDGTFATAAIEHNISGNFFYSNTATSGIEVGTTSNEVSRVADLNQDGRLDIVWMVDSALGSDSGVYVWLGKCADVPASPTLSKAFSPTNISVGQTSTLTFTITNSNDNEGFVLGAHRPEWGGQTPFTITNSNGNLAQNDIFFTDTLPDGLVLAAVPASPQCGGTVSGAVDGNTISLSNGSLASGTGSCTITAIVKATTSGTKINNASNITETANLTLNSEVFGATLTVNENPRLYKQFSPSTITLGETSTVTFTIDNGGPYTPQNGIAFTDTLPDGLTLASAPTTTCNGTVIGAVGGNTIGISNGSLPVPESSCKIKATVTASTSGSKINNKNRVSGISNLNVSSETFGATLTVAAAPPVLSKAFNPSTITIGQNSTLTFTINNSNGNPAQNGIAFTDTLPDGLTLASAPTTTCGGTAIGTVGGKTIGLSNGSMTSGTASCTITATVTASTQGTKVNNYYNLSPERFNLNIPEGFGATLTVNATPTPVECSVSDPLVCTGPNMTLSVHAEITNPNPAASTFTFNAPINAPLSGLPGTCVVSGGTCTLTANNLTVTGPIGANQTITIDYKVQVAPGTPQGTNLCITSTGQVAGAAPAMVTACTALNCPVVAKAEVSDQKMGSVLVYPYYTSKAAQQADTRLTLTNVGPQPAFVHLFMIDGTSCNQADFAVCLTPFASFSFKASEFDPEATGYLLAVAVDAKGLPIQNNSLIGNAFVSDGDYVDNYGAEAFWAHSPAVAAINANGTATLFFDGSSYDGVPNQFTVELQSPLDAGGQQVVTASLSGDVSTGQLSGAAQVGVGLVINEREAPIGSFTNWLLGKCQARATVTTTSPRVPTGMGTLLKSGEGGTMRLNVGAAVGLLMTPRTAPWRGIRTLHKTGLTATTLTIPIFIPTCS